MLTIDVKMKYNIINSPSELLNWFSRGPSSPLVVSIKDEMGVKSHPSAARNRERLGRFSFNVLASATQGALQRL